MLIELLSQLVRINAVDHAGFLKSFASGSRAEQAVHPHCEEILRSSLVVIEDIAYYCFLCYFKCYF